MRIAALATLRRPKVFYGWWVVLTGVIGEMLLGGPTAWALTVFVEPMTGALGWSRGQLSAVVTVRTIVSGIMGPLFGPLVDRKNGPRILGTIGTFLGGLGFFLAAFTTELWQFYLTVGVLGALGGLCFGALVTNTLAAKWFVRKRGIATGFLAMGVSAGGFTIQPLARFVIDAYSWKMAWMGLGILSWVIVMPLTWVFIRRQPEDMGLLPDGDAAPAPQVGPAASPPGGRPRSASEERSWTAREALKCPSLWLQVIGFNIALAGGTGFLLHFLPFIKEQGFSSGIASAFFSTIAIGFTISRLIWGALADRFPVRYCATVALTVAAMLMVAILNVRSTALAFPLMLAFGLFMGGTLPLMSLMMANYFGRGYLGTIRGFVSPVGLLSTGGGPLLTGILYDVNGNYEFAYTLFVFIWLGSAFLVFLARPPRPPAPRGAVEPQP